MLCFVFPTCLVFGRMVIWFDACIVLSEGVAVNMRSLAYSFCMSSIIVQLLHSFISILVSVNVVTMPSHKFAHMKDRVSAVDTERYFILLRCVFLVRLSVALHPMNFVAVTVSTEFSFATFP